MKNAWSITRPGFAEQNPPVGDSPDSALPPASLASRSLSRQRITQEAGYVTFFSPVDKSCIPGSPVMTAEDDCSLPPPHHRQRYQQQRRMDAKFSSSLKSRNSGLPVTGASTNRIYYFRLAAVGCTLPSSVSADERSFTAWLHPHWRKPGLALEKPVRCTACSFSSTCSSLPLDPS